jgi:hypothetical protein
VKGIVNGVELTIMAAPFDHNDYVKLAELLSSTADLLSKRFQT